jgi:hypothetical protein
VREPSAGEPLLPIELAISGEAPEQSAHEFIDELVDVRHELRELIDGSDEQDEQDA